MKSKVVKYMNDMRGREAEAICGLKNAAPNRLKAEEVGYILFEYNPDICEMYINAFEDPVRSALIHNTVNAAANAGNAVWGRRWRHPENPMYSMHEYEIFMKNNNIDALKDMVMWAAKERNEEYVSLLIEDVLLMSIAYDHPVVTEWAIRQLAWYGVTEERKLCTYYLASVRRPELIPRLEEVGIVPTDGIVYEFLVNQEFEKAREAFDRGFWNDEVVIGAVEYDMENELNWLLHKYVDEREGLQKAIKEKKWHLVEIFIEHHARPQLVELVPEHRIKKQWLTYCEDSARRAEHDRANPVKAGSAVTRAIEKGTKLPRTRATTESQIAWAISHYLKKGDVDRVMYAMMLGREAAGYMFDHWLPGGSLKNMMVDAGIRNETLEKFVNKIGSF